MKLYEKNFIINIIEAKLLETFEDYSPQGIYNNKFISYMYDYIRLNTYSGEHNNLLEQFIVLKNTNNIFRNTLFVEKEDNKTFVITDDTGITNEMYLEISNIVKNYYNYEYTVLSKNRIEIKINFGWLPPNTSSWLNLLNDECLIDYYIKGTTLIPNTHSTLGNKRPDSGYVCYKIDKVNSFDTIMFIADKASMEIEGLNVDITVASLLNELKSSRSAILSRLVTLKDVENFFYELGSYANSYLSTEDTSLIIQVPYDYAISEYYYVFNVSNSVIINNKNDTTNPNSQDNYFVSFDNPNFSNMFIKNDLHDKTSDMLNSLVDRIISQKDKLDDTTIQYILGDFIWKTSDSKLIAYAQNLINAIDNNANLIPNGIWSEDLSKYIKKSKSTDNENISLFDDDVLDKNTENILVSKFNEKYKDIDYNEQLFNEW